MFNDQNQFKRDFVSQFLAAWAYDKWKSGTVNDTAHLVPVDAARIAAENAWRQVSADNGLMSFQDSMTRYSAANLSQ
jgi:hypothetical protein